jgi:hypothetical protein
MYTYSHANALSKCPRENEVHLNIGTHLLCTIVEAEEDLVSELAIR